jgi:type I restriction enzyme S subunit
MFYKENNFQDSPVGKIPEEWSIGDTTMVTLFIKDGTHTPPERVKQGIPLFSAQNIVNGKIVTTNQDTFITETEYQKIHAKYEIQKNDVLLTIVGTIGNSAVVKGDFKFTLQRSVAIFRPDLQKLEPRFLHYIFQSYPFKRQLKGHSKLTTQGGIYLKELSQLEMPVPKIREQQAVVGVLGVVDSAIELADKVIAKTERLKKGLMEQLLRRGIGHTEYKDSKELGSEIPNEWEVERLSQLIERGIITYHLDGNHGELYPREEEFVDKGVPFLSANMLGDGVVDFAKAKYVTEERARQFRKGIAKDGDVLFAHNATVGPVSVLRTSQQYVILSTSLTSYRCNQDFLFNEYLKYYMESSVFQKQLQRIMKQTTRNQVPITAQKNLYFILPSMEEQKRISNILSAVETKLKIDRKEKTKLERVKQGLMDLLLTGKIRVKVD